MRPSTRPTLQDRFEVAGVDYRKYLPCRNRLPEKKSGAVRIPSLTVQMYLKTSVIRQEVRRPPDISQLIVEHEGERIYVRKGTMRTKKGFAWSTVTITRDHYNLLMQGELLNGASMSQILIEALDRRSGRAKK